MKNSKNWTEIKIIEKVFRNITASRWGGTNIVSKYLKTAQLDEIHFTIRIEYPLSKHHDILSISIVI